MKPQPFFKQRQKPMSMPQNNGFTARLNPFWLPWMVPRVARSPVQAIAAEKRASLIARLVKRRKLTPLQRVRAIHIINATYPADPNLAESSRSGLWRRFRVGCPGDVTKLPRASLASTVSKRRRAAPARALQPVLIQEPGQRRMAQLRSQDAEQRGHRLLAIGFEAEKHGRALGPGTVAGFGSGPRPNSISKRARGRSELVTRHFMQQYISLGFGAQRRAVPGQIESRRARLMADAETC